jgi:hypothetical protein
MAGAGIGEAALIGAAFGGGAAAITGGDPLKGALLGGITGGAGAALPGMLPAAAAPVAEGAVLSNAGTGVAGAGIDSLATQTIANNPGLYPSGFGSANTATLFTPTGASYAIPSATSNIVPPAVTQPPTFFEGLSKIAKNPTEYLMDNRYKLGAAGLVGALGAREEFKPPNEEYNGPLKRFRYNPDVFRPSFMAEGGIADLTSGGYDRMVGEEPMYQPMASGGISDLGSYSDGGRMLKGPGDGMSDSIPASISGKRPARLAEGEFVVPADVVSHLGNGSTDAGAKQLYAMMNKVRKDRTGRAAQGREINPRKYVPA